jgi:hypothetical protein
MIMITISFISVAIFSFGFSAGTNPESGLTVQILPPSTFTPVNTNKNKIPAVDSLLSTHPYVSPLAAKKSSSGEQLPTTETQPASSSLRIAVKHDADDVWLSFSNSYKSYLASATAFAEKWNFSGKASRVVEVGKPLILIFGFFFIIWRISSYVIDMPGVLLIFSAF